jgi:hypothetical protein
MSARTTPRNRRPASPRPRWIVKGKIRTLYLGRRIVKRLDQLAGLQEPVLYAFEAQGWPQCIANPFTGLGRKRRLHEAIENLNRHQRTQLIHFYGDGTGTRICWRLIAKQ